MKFKINEENVYVRYLKECFIPGFKICVPYIGLLLFVFVPFFILASWVSFVWFVISLIISVPFVSWYSEDRKQREAKKKAIRIEEERSIRQKKEIR